MSKSWPDIVLAMQVWDKDNWVGLEESETESGIMPIHSLMVTDLEKIHYRKELVSSLTGDAKYLLKLVLDTPDDFTSCICGGKENDPKKTRITAFLSISGWNKNRICGVFNEISMFIRMYYGQ